MSRCAFGRVGPAFYLWFNVTGVQTPSAAITLETATALANVVQKGLTGLGARLRMDWRPGTYPTQNVIAETRTGDPDNVIVVGAHLDPLYDGDLSDSAPPPGGAPPGSADIEQLFLDYFASQGLANEPTAFDGRSDYGPFIAAGIPAGGLFTGAEEIKTPEQVALYGGTAGIPFDICYHQGCDDLFNLDTRGYDQMADAAAHVMVTLAQAKTLPERGLPAPVAAARSLAAAAPHGLTQPPGLGDGN